VAGESKLTYGEVDSRADRWAQRLSAAGVGAETPVGVCLERSAEMVVALLAILKAGGAYVPLDPSFPAERLRFILADTGTKIVVSQRGLAGCLPEGDLQVIDVDEVASS